MDKYLTFTIGLVILALAAIWVALPECATSGDCIDYPCLGGDCQCPPELMGYWRCNIDDHVFHPDLLLIGIVGLGVVLVALLIYYR